MIGKIRVLEAKAVGKQGVCNEQGVEPGSEASRGWGGKMWTVILSGSLSLPTVLPSGSSPGHCQKVKTPPLHPRIPAN